MARPLNTVLVVAGLVAVILILALAGILPGRKTAKPQPATLEFWGLKDDDLLWRPILEKFRKEKPHLTVNYRRFDEISYEENLINKMAEGRGPDIFFLKNSWVEKHRDKILPLPQEVLKFTVKDFQKTFVDVASQDLTTSDNQILGLPLFVDTLALFYNKDVFNAGGVAETPKTWGELEAVAKNLTKKTAAGDITKSGVALGGSSNIEHALEILSAFVLQGGDKIINRANMALELGAPSREALDFYTSFANAKNPNFSWTLRQPKSLDAFSQELTAMALGFADDLPRVKAKNPHLNFGVSFLPQRADAKTFVTYGSYFFPTVSRLSNNPLPAWEFILFAASADSSEIYTKNSGKPPARRDLLAKNAAALELDIFYRQALTAKSWPITDEKITRRLFEDTIESVVTGGNTTDTALNRLREKLSLSLP
ncbi:MAG: extracellular solute-binding protein [Candidatus Sungiibacteriota bacterium]|uniref:Extracellular solute-binding protein n=1 Tax=Candidatus Sungiibacteriota bacterium TaxID=2750080 RepID=A0A7T5RK65_9BACT|nr:MAG: extracellular solute-binding protein [Candidatus Sungbacteria bacterium]